MTKTAAAAAAPVLAGAFLVLAAGLAAAPARAQLMLPGALQASPSGEETKPGGPRPGGGAPALRASAQKAPGEAAVVGRTLARDGASGAIAFQTGPGKILEVTRLSFVGVGIAHPGEPCRVDVVADAPIAAQSSGRNHGLARYEVSIEACPFSIDILDGAVLVSRTPGPCDFAAADCRVDPAGLWGPPGEEIDDKQIKVMERERGRAEGDMRTTFRALLSSAGKDKAAVKQIAADQAGFSSLREVVCRNYAKEDVHGFCALRMTQARVLALQADFEANGKDRHAGKSAVVKARAKPQEAIDGAAPERP